MKNFIFISPNFPVNYWNFCRELKNNGLNVLGIGDQPYDDLSQELKDSLNEYYKVGSLENYDEVYRAVALNFSVHSISSPLLDPDEEKDTQRTFPIRCPLPLTDTLLYSPEGIFPLPDIRISTLVFICFLLKYHLLCLFLFRLPCR